MEPGLEPARKDVRYPSRLLPAPYTKSLQRSLSGGVLQRYKTQKNKQILNRAITIIYLVTSVPR